MPLKEICRNVVTLTYIFKIIIFWASLIGQLVKNPPAMQKAPVQFLGWENPLEKE